MSREHELMKHSDGLLFEKTDVWSAIYVMSPAVLSYEIVLSVGFRGDNTPEQSGAVLAEAPLQLQHWIKVLRGSVTT